MREKLLRAEAVSQQLHLEKAKLEEKARYFEESKQDSAGLLVKMERLAAENGELREKVQDFKGLVEEYKKEVELQKEKNKKVKDLKRENQEQRTRFAELNAVLQQVVSAQLRPKRSSTSSRSSS